MWNQNPATTAFRRLSIRRNNNYLTLLCPYQLWNIGVNIGEQFNIAFKRTIWKMISNFLHTISLPYNYCVSYVRTFFPETNLNPRCVHSSAIQLSLF
jgi:hypothetical protein